MKRYDFRHRETGQKVSFNGTQLVVEMCWYISSIWVVKLDEEIVVAMDGKDYELTGMTYLEVAE